jgi:hypothetical protein
MNFWNEREELRHLRERYELDKAQWRSEYWSLHAEWEAAVYHNRRLQGVLSEIVRAYQAADPNLLREAVERAVNLLGLEEEVATW